MSKATEQAVTAYQVLEGAIEQADGGAVTLQPREAKRILGKFGEARQWVRAFREYLGRSVVYAERCIGQCNECLETPGGEDAPGTPELLDQEMVPLPEPPAR